MLQPKWLVGCIKIGPVRMTTLTMTLQTSHCTRSIADLTGTVFVATKQGHSSMDECVHEGKVCFSE